MAAKGNMMESAKDVPRKYRKYLRYELHDHDGERFGNWTFKTRREAEKLFNSLYGDLQKKYHVVPVLSVPLTQFGLMKYNGRPGRAFIIEENESRTWPFERKKRPEAPAEVPKDWPAGTELC